MYITRLSHVILKLFKRAISYSFTAAVLPGDTVQLNTGRSKGKSGKVKKVIRSRNRLVVEGLNLVRKHVRPIEGRAGGVISIEAPLHYSNVNLVDAASG